MNEEWWESPVCFFCDHWLPVLLAIVLATAAYFTRSYWLPSSVDLCFFGRADIKLSKAIPYHTGKTDILFAFDLSGSMMDVISGAQQEATRFMKTVAARIGSEHFGVTGFSDYGDIPYRLYQPITKDRDLVQAAINGLSLVDGGDAPEAYGRLTYESFSDPNVGWREGSKRYLVIFGDSIPHDPDAGRDEQMSTPDDLVWNQVLKQLSDHQIELIYVASPTIPAEVAQMWKEWSGTIAGLAVNCSTP